MTKFSDYIVYADESGDHGLISIDPDFTVFGLVFCIMSKAEYSAKIVPAIQDFKFKYWGHDMVVLHESELSRKKGDFALLKTGEAVRKDFFTDLDSIVAETPVLMVASVIDKVRLREQYAESSNPYEVALLFCLEQLFDFLIDNSQEGKTVHVVFESRGKKEDRDLGFEFHRICNEGQQKFGIDKDFDRIKFVPKFAKKSVNSTGLQIADLVVRPIALHTMRPNQKNQAFETIKPKLIGHKVFP